MIRPYVSQDAERIIHIWRKASEFAHPFLSDDFHDMAATAIRDIYLPKAETYVTEINSVAVASSRCWTTTSAACFWTRNIMDVASEGPSWITRSNRRGHSLLKSSRRMLAAGAFTPPMALCRPKNTSTNRHSTSALK